MLKIAYLIMAHNDPYISNLFSAWTMNAMIYLCILIKKNIFQSLTVFKQVMQICTSRNVLILDGEGMKL